MHALGVQNAHICALQVAGMHTHTHESRSFMGTNAHTHTEGH